MGAAGIIVGAGEGKRLAKGLPKALVPIAGKPMFLYSVEAFIRAKTIDSLVIVLPCGYIEDATKWIPKSSKPIILTKGGKERFQSVLSALQYLEKGEGIVAIHDASRPFVEPDLIDRAVRMAEETGEGVILALPVRDTVKYVEDNIVRNTVDRTRLWLAQTPQVFPSELIREALKGMPQGFIPTDDAQAVELYGKRVRVIKGSELNIKITYPEDIKLAEAIVERLVGSEFSPDGFRTPRITENGIC